MRFYQSLHGFVNSQLGDEQISKLQIRQQTPVKVLDGQLQSEQMLPGQRWLELWLFRWRRAQVPPCCGWIFHLPVRRAAMLASSVRLLPLSCGRNFCANREHTVMEKTTTSKEAYRTLRRHMRKRPDLGTIKDMLDTILDLANPDSQARRSPRRWFALFMFIGGALLGCFVYFNNLV